MLYGATKVAQRPQALIFPQEEDPDMKVGTLVIGGALLLATASVGRAGEVNCKQVNKYLQTGRSVKDVAETMVISESDVEKCKAADTGGGSGDTKGGDAKGAPTGAGH